MHTHHLALPLLAAGQAQKHVTHNDALLVLDDLIQLAVISLGLTVPPASPAEGDRYIIGDPPSGAWSGRTGLVAVWRDEAWSYHLPRNGWQAVVEADGGLYRFDGTAWQGPSRFSFLGVNATADAQNRFAVSSTSALFNHNGSGHQLKINKANAAATGSLLFQTGFSGRAEIGLSGSDNLAFKTSSDGFVWQDALRIDANGAVTFPSTPNGVVGTNLIINGDFTINQRAFAGGVLAQDVYGYDRWKAAAGGANVAASGGVVTLTSGAIQQTVEAEQWGYSSFAGQSLTLSVEQSTAPLDVQIGGITAVIPASSSRTSTTITLPAGFTGALNLRLARSGTGAVSFRRVKLELGANATPWIARPLTQEQSLAQRYYYRITGPLSLFLYAQASGNYFFNSVPLPVLMRTTPVVSRTILTSGNIFQNDLANATASGLSASAIRLSVRANGAGECYANFDRVECSAEM
jgi:Protein of unknown function (DUF2793)